MSPYLPHGPGDYVEPVPRGVHHPDDGATLVEHPNRDYSGDYTEHAEEPDDEALEVLARLLPLSVITPPGEPPALLVAEEQPPPTPPALVEQPAPPVQAQPSPAERSRSLRAAATRAVEQRASADVRAAIDAAAASTTVTGPIEAVEAPERTGVPPVRPVDLTPARAPGAPVPAEPPAAARQPDEHAVAESAPTDTLGHPPRVRARRSAP